MSDHEDSQNPSVHSYGSSGRSPTFGSFSSSSSDSEHPATSPQKKPADASTCAPSSSVAHVVSTTQSGDEGFIQLDDRLLQEQPSYMQKPQVHELRNLMPDGYQLTYRATWKSIIPLHASTSIGIHYHSIKDLGEFSIHPFKVLFLETYGIMPGQLAPNGHRLLGSFINVCRFLRIPLSLHLFDYMFDVWPGSKETLGFVVVSSHQGRAFLCGLPPSNKKWKDKYVCVKFPPTAFPFAQNVWGKRMKRQVKPAEADDLVAWEATLRAGDASTHGLYHVGKWSVYPGRETDPEPEIVLPGAIPEAIPIRQARGSKAPATTNAGPSRPAKKKKEKGQSTALLIFHLIQFVLNFILLTSSFFVSVVKFQSKFAVPEIVLEEPITAQPINPPSSQPFSLEEQPTQSHQGTNQPIHSGDLYINVDTFEFDTLMGEAGHTSQAGRAGQPNEEGEAEEEVAEESLQRKRRRTEEVNQPAHQGPQSSDAGKGPNVPRSGLLMSRSNEELFQAFRADLNEVGRIGEEYFARLVKSMDEEKARMEAMMVECRKEAQAARAKAEKIEAKWTEHSAIYRQLYAKHDGLLKAAKEADEQAQAKIQQLEAEIARAAEENQRLGDENARSAEEIARLSDELQKEQSERAAVAAAWAAQAPEEFAAEALPDRETAIRFFQGLYKHPVSAGLVDEIGTYGFESGQYSEQKALYGILVQRVQSFQPKVLSLPELHDEAPVPPFPGI
ncbi:unnamed protein product [Cuscuta campestris]|uniref:Transposase (putative) gypsy type domain-containing protein n=1 Tax=Cuscuta campestris TaxID=132261 RepID=A0A484NK03_9ASTE|nr:unnamed protein product [Cuscuta campestris]